VRVCCWKCCCVWEGCKGRREREEREERVRVGVVQQIGACFEREREGGASGSVFAVEIGKWKQTEGH
jgi:hypothetical protein